MNLQEKIKKLKDNSYYHIKIKGEVSKSNRWILVLFLSNIFTDWSGITYSTLDILDISAEIETPDKQEFNFFISHGSL